MNGGKPYIFEPHNGFGGATPDGDPWPFGYISEKPGRPIFELHGGFIKRPAVDLARVARLFAMSPELLSIIRDSVEIMDVAIESREKELDGDKDEVMRNLRCRARAAIAVVKGGA